MDKEDSATDGRACAPGHRGPQLAPPFLSGGSAHFIPGAAFCHMFLTLTYLR